VSALVEINGLWKGFSRESADEQRSLAGRLWRTFWGGQAQAQAPRAEMDWALRDVSVQVRRGAALGIVGHNGAGKTTLLRTLMGEYQPDRGAVSVSGKACGLIDLLAGFNPALTGRENIYVRGGYLGFTLGEVAALEQSVVEFADIGEFIDRPMQIYSQGMRMRLGFAVAIAVAADVMIIDEILAVGDFMFHNKCMAKMNELRAQRATVLVSHSMEMIVQFSDEVLVLDRGRVAFLGDPIEAIETYRRLEMEKSPAAGPPARANPRPKPQAAPTPTPPAHLPAAEIADAPNQVVAGRAHLYDVADAAPDLAEGALDPASLPSALRAVMGDFAYNRAAVEVLAQQWTELRDGRARLTLEFVAVRAIARLVVGVPMWTAHGAMVTAFGTQGRRIRGELAAGTRQRVELIVPRLALNRGVFYPVMAIMDGTEYLYRWPMAPLEVLENPAAMVWGLMTTHYEWRQTDLDGS
jgi:ABC-type polysaccharide/polyol phosphate transport system ATPase subunit